MLVLICLRYVSIMYFRDFFIVHIYPTTFNVLVYIDFVSYLLRSFMLYMYMCTCYVNLCSYFMCMFLLGVLCQKMTK